MEGVTSTQTAATRTEVSGARVERDSAATDSPAKVQCGPKMRGHVLSQLNCNGGDTQSRNLHKKLVQVDLYKKLDRLTWFLVQDVSCTSFFHRIQQSSIPYKKLACT